MMLITQAERAMTAAMAEGIEYKIEQEGFSAVWDHLDDQFVQGYNKLSEEDREELFNFSNWEFENNKAKYIGGKLNNAVSGHNQESNRD